MVQHDRHARGARHRGWALALGVAQPVVAGEVIFGDGFDRPLRTGLDFASNGAAPADAFIAFQFPGSGANRHPAWAEPRNRAGLWQA